ncbi:MAG: histidinol phosphate aminotransferase [Desulfococcus sp.]|nr:MAG: histidinol phosphate aminotransferase [Desulfococcus sp.]
MITGHGGDIRSLARRLGCAPEEILDASSNMNPFGPPPGLLDHLRDRLADIRFLPDAAAASAIRDFIRHHELDKAIAVLPGNGTTQLIHALPLALRARRALIMGPTYADYADACAAAGTSVEYLMARPEDGFQPNADAMARRLSASPPIDLVFICNPNNPTGQVMARRRLEKLVGTFPQIRFIIDESYLAFMPDAGSVRMMDAAAANLGVLHSMSKIFRVPGLRIGFLAAGNDIAGPMAPHIQPWCLSAPAQAAVSFLCGPASAAAGFIRSSAANLRREHDAVSATLAAIPEVTAFPSAAPFLLIRLPAGIRSGMVCKKMAAAGILVRDCANFTGLSDAYIRISLKTPPENQRILGTLSPVLSSF